MCVTCAKSYSRQKGNFRPSYSYAFKGNNNYLPVCINCLEKELRKYIDEYGDEFKAFERVCQRWDIYYSKELHIIAKQGKGIDYLIGTYFSRMQLFKKDDYKKSAKRTYDDTIAEKEDPNIIESIDDVKENKEIKISQKTIRFWGVGYNPDEYKLLDDEYTSWVIRANNGENPTKSMETALKEMCKSEIDLKRAREGGAKASDILSLQNSFIKWMTAAGLKPSQEDTTNIAEKNALGVLIDYWENTEPVPKYPEENILKKYINIWFKGHLSRSAGLKNDTQEEYKAEIEKYKTKIMEDMDFTPQGGDE